MGEQLAAKEEELWAHVRTAVKARQSIGQSSRAATNREQYLTGSLTRTHLPPKTLACQLRPPRRLRATSPQTRIETSGKGYPFRELLPGNSIDVSAGDSALPRPRHAAFVASAAPSQSGTQRAWLACVILARPCACEIGDCRRSGNFQCG